MIKYKIHQYSLTLGMAEATEIKNNTVFSCFIDEMKCTKQLEKCIHVH